MKSHVVAVPDTDRKRIRGLWQSATDITYRLASLMNRPLQFPREAAPLTEAKSGCEKGLHVPVP